jgi:hypothetical protein
VITTSALGSQEERDERPKKKNKKQMKVSRELVFEEHTAALITTDDITNELITAIGGTRSPRLLCIHGRNANMEISEMQMARLGLSQDFSITYLEGPHVMAAKPASDASTGPAPISPTPLMYSWAEQSNDVGSSDSEVKAEEEASGLQTMMDQESLFKSLLMIMKHVQKHGPYEAVYGFSQGAALATVLSSKVLRLKICDYFGEEQELYHEQEQQRLWSFVFTACAANDTIWRSVVSLIDDRDQTEPTCPLSTFQVRNSLVCQITSKSNLRSIYYVITRSKL